MTQTMYQDYFGIAENPFSIIPDPRYLYMSQRHQDALAHLAYGVSESGGFVLLTGEVGTGKTTLCRALMEKLPEDTDLALILNPKLTELELMATICDEMRISYPHGTSSLKIFFDCLTHHLLHAHARGRNPVLLIDEAQNLSPDVMELVRLLTNLETADKKLLQIILVGQPELNATLALPSMRQTSQRITARYHLHPLGLAETSGYIQHRLKVAGLDDQIFNQNAVDAVYKITRGIPRLINSVCDRTLLAAYVENKKVVDAKLVARASQEVLGENNVVSVHRPIWGPLSKALALTLALLVVGGDPFGWGVRDKIGTFIQAHMSDPHPYTDPKSRQTAEPQDVATAEPEPEPEAETAEAPVEEISTSENAVTETAPETMDDDAPAIPITESQEALVGDPGQVGSQDAAYVRLFKFWKQEYLALEGTTPCTKASQANLSCTMGLTDMNGLKAMNRPVVTSFSLPSDERVYGVVTSIKTEDGIETVTIDFGDRVASMTIQDFALRWPGDYMVLWMPHDIIHRDLLLGDEGQDVVELRRILFKAGIGGTDQDGQGKGSTIFDPGLRDMIRAFQVEQRLSPTGTVDSETLMHLSGSAAETFNAPMAPRDQ